jgi:hypothetical protein|nr:MAG TPA: Transcription-silencing protein, cryptic loci regulator Clr2 [Caudoviricetes sp.]
METVPYILVFRRYYKEELRHEERHLFSSLRDLYAHAAWLIGDSDQYAIHTRYDIRVELAEIDPIPPAA